MNFPKKMFNSKVSRDLTYKTVTGILPILQRFSASTGITDINELSDFICSMTVDDFCDYKFKEDL